MFAPLLGLLAVAIELDSPGPAIFGSPGAGAWADLRDREVPLDGGRRGELRPELLPKPRCRLALFKVKAGDPRVTRVGPFLGRTSLDELPQLWNVLPGDEPRRSPPPPVDEDAASAGGNERGSTHAGDHGAVAGSRTDRIPFAEMVKLDYVYVTNWSLWWT